MDWQQDGQLRTRLIECLSAGYQHKETLLTVAREFTQYPWSLRTLKRRLKFYQLLRNDSTVDPKELIHLMKLELAGPGKLLGYRALHKRIRMKYGLLVKRNDVYLGMNILAPQNLEHRKVIGKRKRFHARQFYSKGPNWMWSIDGHDKLMGLYKNELPLGIHACIDSFSRKIIWLRAWPSNSSPVLPARLYYEAVKEFQVVPKFVRSDRGNENTTLSVIHNFLNQSSDGMSHIYGSSTTNQVIERWWRDYRERNGNFFRALLHELKGTGLYNDKDETSRTLLAMLLIPVLQKELEAFRQWWNTHRIRIQKINRPCGIPNFMYDFPEQFGFEPCGKVPDDTRMQYVATELCYSEPLKFVEDEITEKIYEMLRKSNLMPLNISNLLEAYQFIYRGCKSNGVELNFCF